MLSSLALLLFATSGPGPMAGHSLVYSSRDKVVLMLGGDAVGPAPIWRYTGQKWLPIPNSQIEIRSLAAIATDDEGNVLMHGGSIATQRSDGMMDYKLTAETWLWNGKAWRKVATAGPAPRDHHCMAYDSSRKRFVLFGGSDADITGRSTFYGDTWEWDGKTWNQVARNGPPARCHFAMAYDPIRKQTIMLGGYGARGVVDDRVWAWNGSAWKAITNDPIAMRSSPRMAFDTNRGQLLLYGGENGRSQPTDTWAWNGGKWSLLARQGPTGRTVHAMAYDATRSTLVVYGGSVGNDVRGDTWEFSRNSWKEIG